VVAFRSHELHVGKVDRQLHKVSWIIGDVLVRTKRLSCDETDEYSICRLVFDLAAE
jgi:hypothetical protein